MSVGIAVYVMARPTRVCLQAPQGKDRTLSRSERKKEGSALESACQKEDVPYVGISRKIDLFNEDTQEFLVEVFSVLKTESPSVRVYVHIASPCTAGCSFRFENWRKPGYKKKR